MHARLKQILSENPDVTRKLRALWALHATNGLTEQDLLELLGSRERIHPQLGGPAVARGTSKHRTRCCAQFAKMAREDQSPLVRLYLASALQRVPLAKRWNVLEGLFAHAEDAERSQPAVDGLVRR